MASRNDGAAVGRKPHHLVLVAIMRKAEILRERLIEDAERMWEIYSAMGRDFAAACRTPGRAREIAEAIDRNNGRLIEGRDVECRG